MFKWPKTREDFWREKIRKTQERDKRNAEALKKLGWGVLTVWECAIRGPARIALDELLDLCVAFFPKREIRQAEIDSTCAKLHWTNPN